MQKFPFLLFISAIFIAASSDAQWIKSHGFPGNRLYDIEFDRSSPLPQAGWMLSLEDSVFRTIDGGKTWNRSNANISGTAFAFKFLKSGSNYVGLMVGSSGQ